jgi:hypothetical protein
MVLAGGSSGLGGFEDEGSAGPGSAVDHVDLPAGGIDAECAALHNRTALSMLARPPCRQPMTWCTCVRCVGTVQPGFERDSPEFSMNMGAIASFTTIYSESNIKAGEPHIYFYANFGAARYWRVFLREVIPLADPQLEGSCHRMHGGGGTCRIKVIFESRKSFRTGQTRQLEHPPDPPTRRGGMLGPCCDSGPRISHGPTDRARARTVGGPDLARAENGRPERRHARRRAPPLKRRCPVLVPLA